MAKIRSLPWSTGAVLPEKLRNNETLSARENDYFSKYNDLMAEYCVDVDLDLLEDIEVTCC